MNDSFGQISSPARALATRGFGGKGQTVQILQLPNDVANQARTIRLEGQIASINNNNTARIATPAGDIDVQIRGNPAPQVGQNIEIEIPPLRNNGRNNALNNGSQNLNSSPDQARQAVIRSPNPGPAIPESAQIRATYSTPAQPTPQAQGVVAQQTGITSPVPPNNAAAPQTTQTGNNLTSASAQAQIPQRAVTLPTTVQENLLQSTSLNSTQNTNRLLTPDSIVRLLPTPPAQAQNIATQYAQSLPSPIQNILTQGIFNTSLIAQSAQNTTGQILIQNIVSQPTGNLIQPQPVLTLNTQNLAQPIQNINLLAPATSSNQTINQPFLAPTIPAGQTLPVQSIDGFLQQPTLPSSQIGATNNSLQNLSPALDATLTPTPITTTAQTNPSAQTLGQVDVKILQILPPAPQIQPVINLNTAVQSPAQNVVPSNIILQTPLVSPNSAVSITAQVTGFTAQGLPLVTAQWPGSRVPQSFTLQSTATNLQVGSQLQIVPNANVGASATQASASLARSTLVNPLLQGFQWPAMDDLFNSILQNSPTLASSLTRTLPNAGNPSQLAPAAMALIAAIRTGDMGSWLGERKLDLLQRIGKSDLLSALRQGSRAGARAPAAETAPTSDWRAVPLPMFWEGEIHKITLYTRREDGNEQNQNRPEVGQTRFIFDLSLSRLGDIQLDGLIRDKRLDLVVRTQNSFSLPMQQTMRQAYSGALDHTELTGELNFQGSTNNWVHVLEQKEELGVDA